MAQREDVNLLIPARNDDVTEFVQFDGNDTLFEELLRGEEEESRSVLLKRIARSVFSMTVLFGLFIGGLSIALVYFNLNFYNLCNSTKWQDLPQNVQLVHIYSHCIADQLFIFWYAIDLSLVFSVRRELRTIIILTNLLAGCVATIYRLSTKVTNIYATAAWLGTPQDLLFLITVFYTSWNVIPESNTIWKRIKYSILSNTQAILSFFVYLINLFVIVPYFVKLPLNIRFGIATIMPVFGYIARIVCSEILLRLRIFHPGKLYILLAGLYALTVLNYRIFQANIESLVVFMSLGLIHGIVGFIERLSVLYKKPLLGYVLSKVHYNGYQVERTPKEKRVATDILIMGIVYEIWGSLTTNALLFMYEIQHSIPKEKGGNFSAEKATSDLIIRILYSMVVDNASIFLSVYIIVRKGNLPINKVWFRKWKRFAIVLTINALFPILVASKVMIELTERSYFEHLSERGDTALAERLKMCNYTSYPFK